MLSIYFDESYNHPTKNEPDIPLVYTIAGYISHVKMWNAFQKEWSAAMKEAGIPFFHMTDYESRFGFYKDWSNEKRIAVLQRLHEIIKKHVLKSFATSIILSDYDNLTEKQKYIFGDPHLCALISCMKHVVVLCNEFDYTEPIDYVFEDGSGYNGQIKNLFENMPNEDRKGYRIGSVRFAPKSFPPLQASDILAYEVTKEIARQKHINNKRPTRKSIMNLAVKGLDELFYMEREHFMEVLTFIKENGLYDEDIGI